MKKVLLGDDDNEYRSSYKRVLKFDYKVDETSTSDELVEKAKQKCYALIVTDNDYRDGKDNGGIWAIQEIRKFDKTTPIILQTGAFNNAINRIATEAGATHAFAKGDSKISETFEKYT